MIIPNRDSICKLTWWVSAIWHSDGETVTISREDAESYIYYEGEENLPWN